MFFFFSYQLVLRGKGEQKIPMNLEAVVREYVAASEAEVEAVAQERGATAADRAAAKAEHDAIRTLMREAGTARAVASDGGRAYVLRLKETQSRRTPPAADVAAELIRALLAPFDAEVVLAGGSGPVAAARGPRDPVSFDEACEHLAGRTIDALKRRFVRYNTTLLVTEGSAGDTSQDALPPALVQRIGSHLSRWLALKARAEATSAPLKRRVEQARDRRAARQPAVERLLDEHAHETWSMRVPTAPSEPIERSPPRAAPARPLSRSRSRAPTTATAPSQQTMLSHDPRTTPRAAATPGRAAAATLTPATRGDVATPPASRSVAPPSSRAPEREREREPETRSRVGAVVGAELAPVARPAVVEQFVRRKTKVRTTRLNFGDLHEIVAAVIGIVAAEVDCADSVLTIERLAARLLEASARIREVVEHQIEAARDERSTHETVVTIEPGRRRR